MELARLLQRTGKPLFLAVNKVDSPKQEPEVDEFRRLGIREVLPVSAEHGDGVAELLEEVVKVIPTVAESASSDSGEGQLRKSRFGRAVLCRDPSGKTNPRIRQLPELAAESEDLGDETEPGEDEASESRPDEIKVAIIGRPTSANRLC